MKFEVQMSPAEEVSANDARIQKTGRWLFRIALLAVIPAFCLILPTAPLIASQQWAVSAGQGYASTNVLQLWHLLKQLTVVASALLALLGAILFLAPSYSVGRATAIGLGLCFLASSSMPIMNRLLGGTAVEWTIAHGIWCLSLMLASGALLLPVFAERYLEN